jgi:hypothetical protein
VIITKDFEFLGSYPILPPLTGEGAEGGWGNTKNAKIAI